MAVITECSDGRCKFCPRESLDKDSTFYSTCSNTIFTVDFNTSCNTSSCIYHIKCKQIQYVKLKCLFSVDIMVICNIMCGTEAKVMYDHFFGADGHDLINMIIKPIELCDIANLYEREKHWITTLNTVFPYGLNMDVQFKGIKNAYNHVMENKNSKSIY